MTMPINLVLVRHGESEGNVATRAARAGDGALMKKLNKRHTEAWRLSPDGQQQPGPTGEWLRREFPKGFTRCVTSSYARAMETAASLELPGIEWLINLMLVERNWGHVSSASPEERKTGMAAADLARRERDGIWWGPSGGETLAGILPRLHAFLGQLHREQPQGSVVVVCHGEVMWAFRVLLERMTMARFRELDESRNPHDRIHNCQVLHYSRQPPKGGPLSKRLDWVRSVCPWDLDRSSNNWTKIVRPKFTNEGLMDLVHQYPRCMEG